MQHRREESVVGVVVVRGVVEVARIVGVVGEMDVVAYVAGVKSVVVGVVEVMDVFVVGVVDVVVGGVVVVHLLGVDVVVEVGWRDQTTSDRETADSFDQQVLRMKWLWLLWWLWLLRLLSSYRRKRKEAVVVEIDICDGRERLVGTCSNATFVKALVPLMASVPVSPVIVEGMRWVYPPLQTTLY